MIAAIAWKGWPNAN